VSHAKSWEFFTLPTIRPEKETRVSFTMPIMRDRTVWISGTMSKDASAALATVLTSASAFVGWKSKKERFRKRAKHEERPTDRQKVCPTRKAIRTSWMLWRSRRVASSAHRKKRSSEQANQHTF
jgi:hypothetical protein